METRKFRVYNRTRENFLRSEVILVDASEKHLETLIENLAFQTGTGLWLKPFRKLPAARVLPLFDLVYLNEENSVIQQVELYPGFNTGPLTTQAASALVLPMGSILASQIEPGDQLAIPAPEEMERMTETPSAQASPDPVAPVTVFPAEETQDRHVSAPPLPAGRSGQVEPSIQQLNDQKAESQRPKKESLKTRFMRWLDSGPAPKDRRHARRNPLPGLVAFYWTGGTPKPYQIGDVSEKGVFLLTQELSFPGTIILLTLQRTDSDGEHLEDAISVYAEVVRWAMDGVGLAFIPSKLAGHGTGHTGVDNPADRATLIKFLQRLNLPPRESQQ